MTGLYADDNESLERTAKKIIDIKPDTVRIYPTITLKNTYLEKLFNDKKYIPNSLETSIELCAELLKALVNNGTTQFVLAHLSLENNTPDLAYGTATHALTEMGALVNRDYLLRVAEPKNTQKIVLV